MGLKSAASGKHIVGKFTGQPLTAVSAFFSGGSSPPPPSATLMTWADTTQVTWGDGTQAEWAGGTGSSPSLDFSQASNSQFISIGFIV